jgi:fructose-1,6-bisphosphatase/sedoheptulose 1,7-bisphosphatase-like protein
VNDAVEGTAFASRNIPGATSVLAACLNQKNGFVQTGDYDYMSKLFGPPQLKGKISLELSPSENISIALKELRIHDPLDLTVIVLDRPRNSFEIELAKEAGVNLILIPGGDLIPGLLAVLNPAELSKLKISKIPQGTKGVLLMGSGGWEEGIVVAAAAKAVGGHAQGRIYSEDKEEIEQAKILEVSELVPAEPESILISASPITDDLWFGVSGVDQDFKVRTIAMTSQGFAVSE